MCGSRILTQEVNSYSDQRLKNELVFDNENVIINTMDKIPIKKYQFKNDKNKDIKIEVFANNELLNDTPIKHQAFYELVDDMTIINVNIQLVENYMRIVHTHKDNVEYCRLCDKDLIKENTEFYITFLLKNNSNDIDENKMTKIRICFDSIYPQLGEFCFCLGECNDKLLKEKITNGLCVVKSIQIYISTISQQNYLSALHLYSRTKIKNLEARIQALENQLNPQ